MLRGWAGSEPSAMTANRGEHRDAGLAHSDDMHTGAKHLQKGDDVIEKLVEAELAVPHAAVARVVPVGD